MEIKSRIFFAEEKLKDNLEYLRKGNLDEQGLYNHIQRALNNIRENAFCGIQIPKRLIPKVYFSKHSIDNLWKYDIPKGWRLIYSVGKEGIEILSIILEWIDHKTYEKRFKY